MSGFCFWEIGVKKMISVNCAHFEDGIRLEKAKGNILVVEDNAVYAKIVYSLYDRADDYFKVYDENFKAIAEKNIMTILNPLQFDLNDRSMKTVVYNMIINQINIDQEVKESIELCYQNIVKKIMGYLYENDDIDFIFQDAVDMKDLLKLIGLSVNQEKASGIFEKIQMLIDVLNEIANEKLLVFTNINTFLTDEEYAFVVEQINMNSQTVLLIENSRRHLDGFSYYCLDNDFYLDKICYNKKIE